MNKIMILCTAPNEPKYQQKPWNKNRFLEICRNESNLTATLKLFENSI